MDTPTKQTILNGYPHFHFKSIGSTMDTARDIFNEKKITHGIVTADQQTQGKGRQGKKWIGMEGNLFLTVIHAIEPKDRFFRSFLMGAVLFKVFSRYVKEGLSLKWPNDVLIYDKKVSGILIEVIHETPHELILLMGVGVNLFFAPHHDETPYPTTTLKEHTSAFLSRDTILEEIMTCFVSEYQILENHGFKAYQDLWNDHHRQGALSIQHNNKICQGVFKKIDEKGHLIIETSKGEIKSIASGDIFFYSDHSN